MEQSGIDKLLALRSAWDKFKIAKKDQHKDFEDFYQVFWSYGMEGHHDILEFNNAMCMQLLREQYTLRGECDKCNGYDAEPPCKINWGSASCAESTPTKLNPEMWYYMVLRGLRLGIRPPKISDAKQSKASAISGHGKPTTLTVYDNKIYLICPQGHGYYHDYFIPLEKAVFDLTWTP